MKRSAAITKDELVALAKELGIELTEEDFAKPISELDDNELDTVVGGGTGKNGKVRCFCFAGGWGQDN